jgi:hypothetical protein
MEKVRNSLISCASHRGQNLIKSTNLIYVKLIRVFTAFDQNFDVNFVGLHYDEIMISCYKDYIGDKC